MFSRLEKLPTIISNEQFINVLDGHYIYVEQAIAQDYIIPEFQSFR